MTHSLFRRVLSLALGLALALTVIPAVMPVTAMAEGYGPNGKFLTPIGPIEAGSIAIGSRADMEKIGNNSGYPLDGKYHLTNDINLSGKEWVPIGDNSTNSTASRFTGIFDGQGFVISNLTITSDIESGLLGLYDFNGLFGNAEGATIKNVGLEGTNMMIFREATTYNGGICGNLSSGTISNCYNTGDVLFAHGFNYETSRDNSYTGGICGLSNAGSSIKDCYNLGSVDAHISWRTYAGGISGFLRDSSAITNCYNAGTVKVGGYGPMSHAGGICGSLNASDTIAFCYNTGDVESNRNAGGICGYIYSGGNVITNCYNTGDIATTRGDYLAKGGGGICGYVDYDGNEFTNCYTIGSVLAAESDMSFAGLVFGYIGSNTIVSDTILNCYWNGESRLDQGDGSSSRPIAPKKGIGYGGALDPDPTTRLTSAQMKQQSSFVGFDFSTVWGFESGVNNGYPILRPSQQIIKTEDIDVRAKVIGTSGPNTVYYVDIEWGDMEFAFDLGGQTWDPITHTYTGGSGTASWLTDNAADNGGTASEYYLAQGNNEIVVTNHSNGAVDANFSYAMSSDMSFNSGASVNNVAGGFYASEAAAQAGAAVLTNPAANPAYNTLSGGKISLPTAEGRDPVKNTENSGSVYFAFSGTPDADRSVVMPSFKKVGVITVTIVPNFNVGLNKPGTDF